MNVKFLGIVLVLMLALCGRLVAQDRDLTPSESADVNHSESSANDDKISNIEHDLKPRIIRDSVMYRKGAASLGHKDKSNDPKTEEDDAMSFNFLYYIIQKFKFSDLIDE